MSAKFTCQFTVPHDDVVAYAEQARDAVLNVAERLRNYDTGGVIRDANGNKIGTWKLR